MDTARKMEMKAGLARQQQAINNLDGQIDTFNRHIAVLDRYLSGAKGDFGSKTNPFNEVALLQEKAATQKHIADMKGLQLLERQKMDELTRQLQHAEFVRSEQTMVIELQPKKKIEPIPGV